MASVGSSEVNSGCPAGLSEYVFRTDESVNAKGCVLLCMNMYLQLAGREALSVHELRAAMQQVWKDCIFGTLQNVSSNPQRRTVPPETLQDPQRRTIPPETLHFRRKAIPPKKLQRKIHQSF